MLEKPHKKLDVWKHSIAMAQKVYKVTNTFPSDERYGLVSQMRRAVISIASNIAEGAARQGKREFKNFLSMAKGSLSELDTQFEIAILLEYLNEENVKEISEQLVKIDQMLSGLMRKLSGNGK